MTESPSPQAQSPRASSEQPMPSMHSIHSAGHNDSDRSQPPRRQTRTPWRSLGLLGQLALSIGALATVFTLATIPAAQAESPRPPRSIVQLAQLHIGSKTPARPSALRSWAQEVRLRTSVRIAHEPARVRASSTKLLRYPLLVLAGAGPLAPLSSGAAMRLREHLTAGGLLLIDDVGRAGPSAAFDRDVRRLVKRVMGRKLTAVPTKSVIYRTFYRLGQPVGRRADSRVMEGVRVGKRWAVLYGRNDLLGAFQRSATGGPALPVLPNGERQRELAWRLGVNLVVYAVSLGYKDDHTHVGHLLRRKRGR